MGVLNDNLVIYLKIRDYSKKKRQTTSKKLVTTFDSSITLRHKIERNERESLDEEQVLFKIHHF